MCTADTLKDPSQNFPHQLILNFPILLVEALELSLKTQTSVLVILLFTPPDYLISENLNYTISKPEVFKRNKASCSRLGNVYDACQWMTKVIVKNRGRNAASLAKAFKISTELVAAVVVGTILGFILDNWFDTKPLFIICFFFLGVTAGILNVIKSAKRMQKNLKK